MQGLEFFKNSPLRIPIKVKTKLTKRFTTTRNRFLHNRQENKVRRERVHLPSSSPQKDSKALIDIFQNVLHT